MKRLFIFATLLCLVGCNRELGDGEVDVKTFRGTTTDLEEPLDLNTDLAYKSERTLRKIRFVEAILTTRLGLSNADLDSCISSDNRISPVTWTLSCDDITGYVTFRQTGVNLTGLTAQIKSKTESRSYIETFDISNVIVSTDGTGNNTLSFKIAWSIYKNKIADSEKVASFLSNQVNVLIDSSGQPKRLTSDSLTYEGAEFEIVMTGLNFNFVTRRLLAGAMDLLYKAVTDYRVSATVYDAGVQINSNKKPISYWQCHSSLFCFP